MLVGTVGITSDACKMTMMSRPLPPEILGLVIDQLYDEPTTLRACCLVSKSWIPQTRRYLFAHVDFGVSVHTFESWMRVFLDPSNTPAHHTRSLTIRNLPTSVPTGTDVGGWIRAFSNVVHFHFDPSVGAGHDFSLTPFLGFSPAIRSLRMTSTTFEVFDLVCSFPHLEDLALINLSPEDGTVGWSAPLTSPKLTGSLDLCPIRGLHSAVRRLSDFPNGLHFAKIAMSCGLGQDFTWATDLVSRCSETLETLNLRCFLVGTFSSAPPDRPEPYHPSWT